MKQKVFYFVAFAATVFFTGCRQDSFSIEDYDPEGCVTLWADNLPAVPDTAAYLNIEGADFDGFYYNSTFGTAPFSIFHSVYYDGYNLAMGQGITYLKYLDFETAGYTNLSCTSIDNMQGKSYFFAQCNGDDWGYPAQIRLEDSGRLFKGVSIWINNTTYAYKAISEVDVAGRGYLKEWTGDDMFQLHIIGENGKKADTVTVDLANGFNIVRKWTCIDLSALDSINSIRFILTSTDMGTYGMNTPSCFCFDGLKVLPLE